MTWFMIEKKSKSCCCYWFAKMTRIKFFFVELRRRMMVEWMNDIKQKYQQQPKKTKKRIKQKSKDDIQKCSSILYGRTNREENKKEREIWKEKKFDQFFLIDFWFSISNQRKKSNSFVFKHQIQEGFVCGEKQPVGAGGVCVWYIQFQCQVKM